MRRINGKVTAANRSGAPILLAHMHLVFEVVLAIGTPRAWFHDGPDRSTLHRGGKYVCSLISRQALRQRAVTGATTIDIRFLETAIVRSLAALSEDTR
jgi:hypothetical protein